MIENQILSKSAAMNSTDNDLAPTRRILVVENNKHTVHLREFTARRTGFGPTPGPEHRVLFVPTLLSYKACSEYRRCPAGRRDRKYRFRCSPR